MNKSTAFWAKAFGWFQFGLKLVESLQGVPHGFFGWLGLVGSAATAVAIHAAGSTDGSK